MRPVAPAPGSAVPRPARRSFPAGKLVLLLLLAGLAAAGYHYRAEVDSLLVEVGLKPASVAASPATPPAGPELAPVPNPLAAATPGASPADAPPASSPLPDAVATVTAELEAPVPTGPGNAIDTLVFGDESSEAAHGFTATASEVVAGGWLLVSSGHIGGQVGGGRMNGGEDGDHFFFRAQKLTGDGFIEARIAATGSQDRQVKTGLMMRDKLEPNSRTVFALDNFWDQFGPSVMTRAEAGGKATIKPFPVAKRPFWMRLERKGDTFTTRVSEDGRKWREVGVETVPMGRTIFMGLATTAQAADKINEAVFDQIVTSLPQEPWTAGPVGKLELAGRAELMGMGERARKLLPLDPPSYYGGEITVRMKVDPHAQNYLTTKLWGSEGNGNRIVLTCEGKEIGGRHGGNLDVFVHSVGAVSPGAFWYRTAPLPRWLTAGKTDVEIKLRGTGSLYAYGRPWNYDTYQKKMETANRSLYRLYTHTNPLLAPVDEKQGATPSYSKAPVRDTTTEEEGLARVKKSVNDRIAKILANKKPLSRGDFDYLAECFEIPWCDAYRKPAVVAHLVQALDQACQEFLTKNPGGGGEWGGGYGPHGLAVFRIFKQIQPQLNERVDLGAGAKPRREQWAAMLKASRDSGRFARRTITNQMIIADGNVYKANLGLLALGSPDAFPEKAARRYLREAVGVEEWRGNDLPDGGHEYNFGRNVFMVTAKGTTHEWNWCCHNCYGRMSPYVYEFARLTGDPEMRDKAVVMERAHAALLYPGADHFGFRGLLNEGVICCRNVYHPGNVAYSYINVASSLRDPLLVAGVRQQVKDGQMWDNWFDAAIQPHLPEDFAKVKSAFAKIPANVVLPTTPGQPNFAWADEQNAILSIKYGLDVHFVTFYRRWNAITRIGDAHTITPQNERVIQFQLDDVRFVDAGEYQKVGPEVQTPFTGTPPDKPESAYAGQLFPMARLENGRAGTLPDFYGVRYGDFLIGMNCTYGKKFLFNPPGFKGGTDLISGKPLVAPLTVPPQTTVVFHAPLPPGPLEPDLAINPSPFDAATSVPTEGVKLTWTPLTADARHRVYFGPTATLGQAEFRGESKEPSFDSGPLAAGRTYYWRVDEVNATGAKTGQVWSFQTAPAQKLPWTSKDIGDVKTAGSSTPGDSGRLTITGAGNDLGGREDGFRFTQIPVAGDCRVTVRVESLEAAHGGVKAGILLRTSDDPGSPFVAVVLRPTEGVYFIHRTEADGEARQSNPVKGPPAMPGWLRLTREGKEFTASYSPDGFVWRDAGRVRLDLPAKALAGLGVTAPGDQPATAKFGPIVVENQPAR